MRDNHEAGPPSRHHQTLADRRHQTLADLGAARPASLDVSPSERAAWPTAEDLIAASGQAQPDDEPRRAARRWPRRSRLAGLLRLARQPAGQDRRKLIGAISSAVLMAAVIVVAVLVSMSIAGPPRHHGQPSTAHSLHSLPLLGSWHGSISYAVRHGVVYLVGSAAAEASGNPGPIAVLPVGARPATPVIAVVVVGSAGDGAVRVSRNGQISTFSAYRGGTSVSVSGVSFLYGQ
jgi:hypothetical protein